MTQAQAGASPMERQMQLFARLAAELPGPRARQDEPGVTSYYDVPYAVVRGFRPLVLDLHVPASGSGPFPVLLWVHGGGWAGGSRAMGHALQLVPHGYAVAAAQYRLSGEAKFPAQLQDLKGAVRWLRANAAQYHLDPAHIAGWGASAGAHLASLLALTANQPDLEGDVGGNLDQPSSLQAVVDYFGPADFFSLARPGATPPGGSMEAGLLGFDPAERPDAARTAMPVTHVRTDAPPFLIIHGDVDPLVPFAQSQQLHDALMGAGANSTLVSLPGAIHEDPSFWSEQTLRQVRAFLDQALRPSAVARA